MKVKTEDLASTALDWAVGTANGGLYQPRSARDSFWIWPGEPVRYSKTSPAYSTDWAQGGPTIEREGVNVSTQRNEPGFRPHPDRLWHAQLDQRAYVGYGPTPLVAAMRCYVTSKLGDEVEVPEELI